MTFKVGSLLLWNRAKVITATGEQVLDSISAYYVYLGLVGNKPGKKLLYDVQRQCFHQVSYELYDFFTLVQE